MKKTFSRWGSKAMVFCLGASVFLAAAPVQTFAADQMYTITYRPGRIGTFTSELEDRYEEYAQANGGSVSVSDKTGNIKLELPAGTEYPAAPRQDEIQIKDEYDGKYVISTDWMPATGSVVTESEDYVVDYEALVNGVTYRIEFVDAESSQQVAPPIIAQGNVDQWVTYAAAQRIDTYQLDTDQPEGIREQQRAPQPQAQEQRVQVQPEQEPQVQAQLEPEQELRAQVQQELRVQAQLEPEKRELPEPVLREPQKTERRPSRTRMSRWQRILQVTKPEQRMTQPQQTVRTERRPSRTKKFRRQMPTWTEKIPESVRAFCLA